jgi:NDP-sugar pyrophosphorylase family protein
VPDNLSLVVLAAGLGSRFGGMKQLEPVGPSDETIMDFSVHDARRAGFKRVIFVIRHDMARSFHGFARRFRDPLEIHLAFQYVEDAPKGINVRQRTRPWGTAHAVLAAAPHVSGGFAVCNADDFYGYGAFKAAVEFLSGPPGGRTTWALIGYPAGATLSGSGPVNRAVCRIDDAGFLSALEERRLESGTDAPDATVSMNFWCFSQEIFPLLQSGFDEFAHRSGPDDEFLLPDVVAGALAEGAARVRVLRAPSRWIGLTHPGDLPRVREALREEVAAGRYPAGLWRRD